jgi:hypothetical protein
MANKRRQFLQRTLGGSLGVLLFGGSAAPLLSEAPGSDPWLETIATKKHRAFLDIGSFAPDGTPIRRTRQLLDTLSSHLEARPAEVGVAFGAHSTGLGYLMKPNAWDELGLVELIAGASVRDGDAKALRAATTNWGLLGGNAISELGPRGVHFLACSVTIGRWAQKIADAKGMTVPDATARIIAGLHDGVKRVPSMILAAVQVQRRETPYIAIG